MLEKIKVVPKLFAAKSLTIIISFSFGSSWFWTLCFGNWHSCSRLVKVQIQHLTFLETYLVFKLTYLHIKPLTFWTFVFSNLFKFFEQFLTLFLTERMLIERIIGILSLFSGLKQSFEFTDLLVNATHPLITLTLCLFCTCTKSQFAFNLYFFRF